MRTYSSCSPAEMTPALARLLHHPGAGRDEGKAVRADHRARLGDEAVADPDPRADPDAVQDQRVAADHRILGDRDMAEDPRPRPGPHPRADDDERPDRRIRADLGGRIDHRAGMDARRDLGRTVEDPADAREHVARPRRENRRLEPQRLPVGARPEQRRPRAPACERVRIGRLHRERELVRPRCRRLGDPREAEIPLAQRLGAERACQLCDGDHVSPRGGWSGTQPCASGSVTPAAPSASKTSASRP